jgi:hypothetical protein
MKQAIVIDSSREIPSKYTNNKDIFPLGYSLQDSKGQIYQERIHTHELNTAELLSIVNNDKKTQIFAPSIKEFVELYTFLAEEYDSLISIHSSQFTPAVFEHALVAKKMVSGISIDLIDSPTIGPAAGLFVAELVDFIPKAKTINDIRKKSIELNRYIHSFTVTECDLLGEICEKKGASSKGFPLTPKSYNLYHYTHSDWEKVSNNRNSRTLFKDLYGRMSIERKNKGINQIFYSSSTSFMRDAKDVLRRIRKVDKTETSQSLISRYLFGRDFSSIAFL